jgi:hypothetical protein
VVLENASSWVVLGRLRITPDKMRLPSLASSAPNRECDFTSLLSSCAHKGLCSIRLMFSIGDISGQQEQEYEQMENEEGEEAESEDQPIHSYPIRCSFSITKVGAGFHRDCSHANVTHV